MVMYTSGAVVMVVVVDRAVTLLAWRKRRSVSERVSERVSEVSMIVRVTVWYGMVWCGMIVSHSYGLM